MANGISYGNDPFEVDGAVADPFGASPHFPRQPKARRSRCTDVAAVIILPWLVFLLTVGFFLFVYHELPTLVWVLLAALIGLALLFLSLGLWVRHGTFLALGFMCLLSLATGIALGLWLDSQYMTPYSRLDGSLEVSGVDPRGALERTQDAGMIHFIPEAFVDDRRSIGFVAQGKIFCVAPVSVPPVPTSAIRYWAIGQNCCEKRSGFDCGSARASDSHSTALVMVEQDPAFLDAIREAETVHGMNSTSGAQLVSFVADPKAVIGDIWDEALTISVVAGIVDLCTCLVVGVMFGRMLLPPARQALLPKSQIPEW